MKLTDALGRAGSETDRLLAFLDSQPDDEIFSTNELREQLHATLSNGTFHSQRARWKDYEVKMVIDGRLQSMWGSKTAIAALRQKEEESRDEN